MTVTSKTLRRRATMCLGDCQIDSSTSKIGCTAPDESIRECIDWPIIHHVLYTGTSCRTHSLPRFTHICSGNTDIHPDPSALPSLPNSNSSPNQSPWPLRHPLPPHRGALDLPRRGKCPWEASGGWRKLARAVSPPSTKRHTR